jgi:hypothetical protein
MPTNDSYHCNQVLQPAFTRLSGEISIAVRTVFDGIRKSLQVWLQAIW